MNRQDREAELWLKRGERLGELVERADVKLAGVATAMRRWMETARIRIHAARRRPLPPA